VYYNLRKNLILLYALILDICEIRGKYCTHCEGTAYSELTFMNQIESHDNECEIGHDNQASGCDENMRLDDGSLAAIKSEFTNIESLGSNVTIRNEEEHTLHCNKKIESETKSDLSDLCPDIHEVRAASTSSSSVRQNEDELMQNELTSELIIKSEHESSDEDNENYIDGK
jgi:hypothetical protein